MQTFAVTPLLYSARELELVNAFYFNIPSLYYVTPHNFIKLLSRPADKNTDGI
jgi:hypothetical protein